MSHIPTAILWKIFYSHCFCVFIDCKNVSLALSCAWYVGMEPVALCVGLLCCLECPGRCSGWQLCNTHTRTENLWTFGSKLFSIKKKTICKSSCKKGKLLLEMDPRCLQRVKTSASWIAKSWSPGDKEDKDWEHCQPLQQLCFIHRHQPRL